MSRVLNEHERRRRRTPALRQKTKKFQHNHKKKIICPILKTGPKRKVQKVDKFAENQNFEEHQFISLRKIDEAAKLTN